VGRRGVGGEAVSHTPSLLPVETPTSRKFGKTWGSQFGVWATNPRCSVYRFVLGDANFLYCAARFFCAAKSGATGATARRSPLPR